MRKINFCEPETPNWKKWRVKCTKETVNLIEAYKAGEKIKVKDLYKWKEIKVEYFFNRNWHFKGKCSFCEKSLNLLDDIDHFRPKKGVTDIDNIPVRVSENGIDKKHPGYYWLAYDCCNLLPVCKECNTIVNDEQNNRRGKGNRFPIEGNYATCPEELDSETPLIINPIFDDPEIFYDFEPHTGHIIIKSNLADNLIKKKAIINIELFGLNTREDLIELRVKAYDSTIDDYYKLHVKRASLEKFKEFKKNIIEGIGSHSIARKKALKYISDSINS